MTGRALYLLLVSVGAGPWVVSGASAPNVLSAAMQIQNVSYDRLLDTADRRNQFIGHMTDVIVAAADNTVARRYVFISIRGGAGFIWVNYTITPPSTVTSTSVWNALRASNRTVVAEHAEQAPGLTYASNGLGTPKVTRITWLEASTLPPAESERLTSLTGLTECNQTWELPLSDIDVPQELSVWMLYIAYILAWLLVCGGCFGFCAYTQKFEKKRKKPRPDPALAGVPPSDGVSSSGAESLRGAANHDLDPQRPGFISEQMESPQSSPRILDTADLKPDLDVAKHHLKVTSATKDGHWRSFFYTRISEMSETGGNGTELYFRLLQILGCTFTLMGGLTLPSAVVGAQGNFAPDIGGELARTTVGNLGFLDNSGSSQTDRFVHVPFLGCKLLGVKIITVFIAWFDLFAVMLFLAVIVFYRFQLIPMSVQASERESLTCRDYTVEVDQLPRSLQEKDHRIYEDLLREHVMAQFEEMKNARKGRKKRPSILGFSMEEEPADLPPAVPEVVLVRDYKGRFWHEMKLAEMKAKRRVVAFHGNVRKLAKLDVEIHGLEKKLEARIGDRQMLPVIRAYVTLNTPANAHDLLHHYRFSTNSLFRKCQSAGRRFLGNAIRVRKAPEPSNVLWVNQDMGYWPRMRRKCVSMIAFLIMIIISMALIYLTLVTAGEESGSSDNYLGISDCDPAEPDVGANEAPPYKCMVSEAETWTIDQLQAFSIEKVQCWCLTKGYTQVFTDAATRDVCTGWLTEVAKRVIIMSMASVVVVLINIILQVVLVRLAHFERSLSISGKDTSIMVKIAVAQTLNTGMVPLIVNFRLPDWMLAILQVIPGMQFVGKGAYDDFVRGWYTVVGLALLVNMLANAITPALQNLFYVALGWFQRWLCTRPRFLKKYAQTELVDLYTNPDFDISTRYAQLIMTVFVTMMYSSGLPLLNWFAAGFMFFMFWVDKYVLLRASKRPPFYDSQMPTQASQIMIYAVPLHCLFAILMLGQPCTFPSGNTVGDDLVGGTLSGTLSTDASVFARLTKMSTWMLFGLLVVFGICWLVWTLLWVFALDALWRCIKRLICGASKIKETHEHHPWEQAKVEIQAKYPPSSYRMEDNPAFKKMAMFLNTGENFNVPNSPTGSVAQQAQRARLESREPRVDDGDLTVESSSGNQGDIPGSNDGPGPPPRTDLDAPLPGVVSVDLGNAQRDPPQLEVQ